MNEAARALGRFTGALLKASGAASDATMVTTEPERLIEQGDVEGALLLAWQRTLRRRIDDAKAADAAAVIVADGSAFDIATAEKALAQKEEARVYPPLRTALNQARAPFQRFGDRRSEWRRALVLPEPAPAVETIEALNTFLSSTTGELEAARDALASAGGVALDDAAAFARGVDLPDGGVFGGVFGDVHVAALVKQALAALPKDARPLQKVPCPRGLRGTVVVDDDAVRLWMCPCLSAGRFWSLARGAGVAVGHSVGGAAHAAGVAFALVDRDARRAALDDGRAAGDKAVRVVVATALMAARARAAAAVVVAKGYEDADEEREVARDATAKATGVDAGDVYASSLLLPPLPDGVSVSGAAVAIVKDAVAAVDVAASYLWLRDQLDAGFLLRPRALGALRELPAAPASPSTSSKAWATLLGELL